MSVNLPVRLHRGLAVVLTASIVTATLVSAIPAAAQTGATGMSSTSREDARNPDSTAEGFTAAAAGLVTGRLLFRTDAAPAGKPVVFGRVLAYRQNEGTGDFLFVDGTSIFDADGDWQIAGLPIGTYRFSFTQDGEGFSSRLWHAASLLGSGASTVTLIEGAPFAFGTAIIPKRVIYTERVAGDTRYSTSVALSQSMFPTDFGGAVVIVNGLNYPDALSAGSMASAYGGPMLLVTGTDIPALTANELNRLAPALILIAGGTAVVSSAVESELQAIAPTASVVRIAGGDRYATSRAVVEATFDPLPPTRILLATGSNYPDALAASAAAGYIGGAVLLVNGGAATLDSATAALLNRYDAPVSIIGGTGSVSTGIEQAITDLGLSVNRVAGADRYATSIEVAIEFFGTADWAYLANGSGFADALSAGPIASRRGAPLYLTSGTCLTNSVWNELNDVLANLVTSVGGTAVLSTAVSTLQACNGAQFPSTPVVG